MEKNRKRKKIKKPKINFHIITLFPESISGYVNYSILKRAIEDNYISVNFYDPKDFLEEGKRADQKPYGGGPGMVIRAEPIVKAIKKAKGRKKKVKIIFLSPNGKQFNNNYAEKVVKGYRDVIIVCGRYEGVDARVKKIFKAEEVSIGPYVLTGGELPAMIIADTVARRVPGVLGNIVSIEENRNASNDVYTRPAVIINGGKKYKVPKVLLSGDHAEIENWRKNTNPKNT